jgi:hypothetical protein
MRRVGDWRLLARCLLAAGLLGGSGCLGFVHPIHVPPPEVVEPCRELPGCSRRQVCIFLANGIDPLCLGNLSGLREYLHALGFTKTWYAQTYHGGWIRREIHRVHKEDPEARFALIGYGHGAGVVRSVAWSVSREGIPIDLLVTLNGSRPGTVPAGGDEACPLPEEHCCGSPSDAGTLQMLAADLMDVAGRIPVPGPPLPPPPAPHSWPETAPPPRPVGPVD